METTMLLFIFIQFFGVITPNMILLFMAYTELKESEKETCTRRLKLTCTRNRSLRPKHIDTLEQKS